MINSSSRPRLTRLQHCFAAFALCTKWRVTLVGDAWKLQLLSIYLSVGENRKTLGDVQSIHITCFCDDVLLEIDVIFNALLIYLLFYR